MKHILSLITTKAHKFTRLSVFVAALTTTAACSHSAQIAEHAGHYNDTLAIVEDEMMLKNILRAAKRRKMHFTRLQSFTGSLSSSVSLTSNLRAGADGATEAFFNPIGTSTSSSPSYALTSLNSKEFNNGIRTPVSASTFDVFLDQGWPLPVLLNILVESIIVNQKTTNGPKFICKIENDPFTQMDRFTEFVKIADGDVNKVPYGDQEAPFGPPMPANQIQNGKQL